MKIRKIVGFGDSWMYGDELLDPQLVNQQPEAETCWRENNAYRQANCALGLLGQHYGLPTENFGIPGGSLDSTQWSYQFWLEREPDPSECLTLIFLTDSSRASFFNPRQTRNRDNVFWQRFTHSTWLDPDPTGADREFQDMIKKYLVLTDCAELRTFRYTQTVLFFDGQRARAHIPTVMMNTMWPTKILPEIPSLPRPDLSLMSVIRKSMNSKRQNLLLPRNHPNEQGHELIRDLLIPEIDRAILHK